MVESIISSFDVWTEAQGVKSKGRVRSIENISLEGITHLREVILELAVRGKLVPQDENDEPANELLKRIEREKAKLIKEGKLKKEKPLPIISENEKTFDLPNGWTWCRLGNIIKEIIGGGTPSKNNPAFWNGSIPWASVKDLKGKVLRSTIDQITEAAIKASTTNLIPKGNIIVCTRMGLGKISVNEIDTAINQDLKGVFLPNEIDKDFFVLLYSTLNYHWKRNYG